MAVDDEHPTPFAGAVDQLFVNEVEAEQLAGELEVKVVITGQGGYLSAAPPPRLELNDDCGLRGAPVPSGVTFPSVNDIADQEQPFRLMVIQKVEQGFSLKSRRAEVKIG
jgi:hypothetical protein